MRPRILRWSARRVSWLGREKGESLAYVIILTTENQNSASPKALTPIKLKETIFDGKKDEARESQCPEQLNPQRKTGEHEQPQRNYGGSGSVEAGRVSETHK